MTEARMIYDAYMLFSILVLVCGIYCVLVSRNLVRTLIGLELLTKSVTLMIIVAGHVTGRMALAQAMVITLIVVEVQVIAVAAGLIVSLFRKTGHLYVPGIGKQVKS